MLKNAIADEEFFAESLLMSIVEDMSDVVYVGTYGSEGVSTTNRGLVVKMQDGKEFHLTVTRSK